MRHDKNNDEKNESRRHQHRCRRRHCHIFYLMSSNQLFFAHNIHKNSNTHKLHCSVYVLNEWIAACTARAARKKASHVFFKSVVIILKLFNATHWRAFRARHVNPFFLPRLSSSIFSIWESCHYCDTTTTLPIFGERGITTARIGNVLFSLTYRRRRARGKS